MKKMILILAMLLIAATSYNQSSRRTANRTQAAPGNEARTNNSSANNSSQSDRERKGTPQRYNDTQNNRQHASTTTRTTEATRTSRSRQPATTQSRNSRTNTQSGRVNSQHENSNLANNNIRTNKPAQTHARPENRHSDTHVRHTRTTARIEYTSPRLYRERHRVVHHYYTSPPSRAYRAQHYVYRAPVKINIIWTPVLHRHYIRMYPIVKHWNYHHGYRIATISAYSAEFYMGEVATVYGRVTEVYYSRSTDEYFLYFGLHYPYQDFTVVIPGWIARKYSHSPSRFFDNQHIVMTGLITSFNGEPEIVVKESFQIHLY
ncbi:hypothetical protein ES705_20728 [subsurface metagenome]